MTAKEAAQHLVRWAMLSDSEQKAAVKAAHDGMRYRVRATGELVVAPHNELVCQECAATKAKREMKLAGILGNYKYK